MAIKTWVEINREDKKQKMIEYYKKPEVQTKVTIICILIFLIIVTTIFAYHNYEVWAINECTKDPNANMFWHTVCNDIKSSRGI